MKEKKPEYWDLYRESNDTFHSRIRKGEGLIPDGLYHITVEVIPTDRKGHILVTRRDFSKHLGAGKYEFPAGSVLSGEVPQNAARRELFEETGLCANALIKLNASSVPGVKKFIFLAEIPDMTTSDIVLQAGETIGYKFVTYDQWLEMISHDRFDVNYRCQFYTPGVYTKLRQMVGKATEQQIDSREAASEPFVKPVPRFSGTLGGLSAPAIFPDEDVELEEKIYPFDADV